MIEKNGATIEESDILEIAGNDEEKIKFSTLSSRLFPEFPDETKLRAYQMEFIYQGITGLAGVVRLLNRSIQLREDQADFGVRKARPLRPIDENHLWCAAIALSRSLKQAVDDLYDEACKQGIGVTS